MSIELSQDMFWGGKIILEQPTTGYRVGNDAVLLAASTTMGFTGSVLDVGSGVGAVGLMICPPKNNPSLVVLVQLLPKIKKAKRRKVKVEIWLFFISLQSNTKGSYAHHSKVKKSRGTPVVLFTFAKKLPNVNSQQRFCPIWKTHFI